MVTTIRGRLIGAFCGFFIFVFGLAFFNWYSIVTIGQKLTVSESFEDLFNDILEARRYEKNFFFYHDIESLKENLLYLERIEKIIAQCSEDIVRVIGKEEYSQFREDWTTYRSILQFSEQQGLQHLPQGQADQIRNMGKRIGDFAEHLVKRKRERIHLAVTRMLGVPIAFFGVSLVLFALVGYLFFRKILRPLFLVQRTIGQVADGNFHPIDYSEKETDEISRLIHAFNQMAIELEAKQEQLVQSRKIAAIGTFTAGIAHELNNPINNISLTAETFLEEFEKSMTPEGRELILDMLNQAERAAEIIKNLLDFSRSERPAMAPLDPAEVIQKTIRLVRNQTFLSGIKVNTAIEKGLPKIMGNTRNLEQIFLNLFLNAIQAMPQGGEIDLKAGLEPDGRQIRIDVKDTGTGIKPEQLEHIFEPFYTTKSVGRGTGLGLSVTYALVKKHNGHIEVQSELNVGTTFSIYLPVAPSDPVTT